MTNDKNEPHPLETLRQRAEARLRDEMARQAPSLSPPDDAQELIHELLTYQVELEIQNEELQLAHDGLAESRDRYADLYDFAPVGYVTLDEKGLILEANLAFADLAGVERGRLIGQPLSRFIAADDRAAFGAFRREAFATAARTRCEMRIAAQGAEPCWTSMECVPTTGEDGVRLRCAVSDITELRMAESLIRERSRLHEALLDTLPCPVFYKDLSGRYMGCNAAFASLLGRDVSEVVGKTVFDMGPPEIAGKYGAKDEELLAHPGTQKYEWKVLAQDGEQRDVVFEKATFTDGEGELAGIVGVMMDVTERNRAERALRHERDFAESLLETAQTIVLVLDTEGRIVRYNAYMAEISGYGLEEVQGKDWFSTFLPPRDAERIRRLFQEAVTDVRTQGNVNAIVTKDGRERLIEWYDRALKDDQGNVVGVLATGQDITERKKADEARDIALAKYRTLFDSFPLGITVSDASGAIVEANAASERLLGVPMGEHVRRKIDSGEWRIVRPDGSPMPPEEYASVRALKEGRQVEHVEMGIVKGAGETTWIDVSASPVPLEGYGVVITYGDITERVTMRRELRAERNRAQQYLDMTGSLFVALDPQGRIIVANRSACRVLGYARDELVGRDWVTTCLPERLWQQVRDVGSQLMTGEIEPVEYFENPVLTKTGEERLIRWHNSILKNDRREVVGILSSGEDITEERRAEEERRLLEKQFHHAQRMEVVGRLAGGVAHDFNNILTGIRGYVGFAAAEAAPGSQMHGDLTETLALADRAAGLTRQLLTFSRRQTIEPVALDLNQVVEGQIKMLSRLVRDNVSVRFHAAEGLGQVSADAGQIEQTLMNLAVNACDAMPDGGNLTFETANVTLSSDDVPGGADLAPGAYVCLAVRDDGCGMRPEVQEHIFEPFFTTKEQGKGTGLGLAAVHGVITQQGGMVRVESEPGEGTTFRICLPRITEPPERREAVPVSAPGGTETILVVDDDASVRNVTGYSLQSLGYTVLIAADGREAEALLSGGDGADLLLTDIVLPGRDGPQLYEALLAGRPGLKVLYMSGHGRDEIARFGVLQAGRPFLSKPFCTEDLAAKVRQVLDDRTVSGTAGASPQEGGAHDEQQ